MRTILKLTATLYEDLVERLREPHAFAGERVAFLKCRPALSAASLLLLAGGVLHVEDGDYVDDPSAGATIGRSGLRKALQTAYNEAVSMVHVHLHEHRGRPGFSRTDLRENARFVPDFWNVQPSLPHGAVVFSFNSAVGQCWIPGKSLPSGVEVAIVGSAMRCTWKVAQWVTR
jgi:hypothetical protein